MSGKQKNIKERAGIGNVSDAADALDRVEWNDFWEKHDIEQDLQDVRSDLRDAYQTFD